MGNVIINVTVKRVKNRKTKTLTCKYIKQYHMEEPYDSFYTNRPKSWL